MGLFNALGSLVTAGVKVVATPITVISDIADIAVGNDPKNTKNLIGSIGDSLEETMDNLTGEL